MRFIFLLAALVAGLTAAAQATENRLYAGCHLRDQGESYAFECDFRSRDPKAVKRVEMTANGAPLENVSYKSFSDGDGKAAWLFLIDRSNPKRAATVRRSVRLVEDLYARSNARNIMAVATFAGDMQVQISPGDPYADVAERLKDVRADGAATAFYFTALQAIDILKGVDADRRALVIISDGKAEDTAYTHADVVKRAREAGVVIYGIGFAERPSETVDLQQVERLASETGGPFASAVGDAPLPRGFIEDFTGYLTNGGSVSAPADGISGEIALALDVTYDDGTSLSGEKFSLYKEPPAPEPEPEQAPEETQPLPLPLIGKIYQGLEGVWPDASQWATENEIVAWSLLALPFVLIAALLLFFLSLRRQRETDLLSESMEPDEAEDTVRTEVLSGDDLRTTIVADGASLGYFEPLDGGERFEIREQNVTIGRHSENDFQLDDDTVHRHHAVFHMSPDKQPVITDLDTENGVVVNGQRVSKTELHSGDVIELGEAKFRFIAHE